MLRAKGGGCLTRILGCAGHRATLRACNTKASDSPRIGQCQPHDRYLTAGNGLPRVVRPDQTPRHKACLATTEGAVRWSESGTLV